MGKKESISALIVVVFQEGSSWVVVGLEHFLVAQGPTETEALETFKTVLEAQVALDLRAGRDPLDGIGPAPLKYWRPEKRYEIAFVA